MIKERILKVELDQAIRRSDHSSYESISAVILETDGVFSVIESEGSLIHDLSTITDSPLDR